MIAKEKRLFTIESMLMLFIIGFVFAHGADPNRPAHQYTTNESGEVWKLMPYEAKQFLKNSINSELDNWYDPFCGYDDGDDIIIGSGEEDYCMYAPFLEHYWDPDVPQEGEYDYGLANKIGSYTRAKYYWKEDVIKDYLKGDINKSYYYLGRVAHLLQDASVPAHMHVDTHLPGAISDDSYEGFIADKQGYWQDTTGKSNFYHWKGSDYIGEEYKYENLSTGSSSIWEDINPRIKEASYLTPFFELFWYTAQKTQYFASNDVDVVEVGL